MTLEEKKRTEDIENIEHNDVAGAKQVILYGKTTGSQYVPLLVNDDGSMK